MAIQSTFWDNDKYFLDSSGIAITSLASAVTLAIGALGFYAIITNFADFHSLSSGWQLSTGIEFGVFAAVGLIAFAWIILSVFHKVRNMELPDLSIFTNKIVFVRTSPQTDPADLEEGL